MCVCVCVCVCVCACTGAVSYHEFAESELWKSMSGMHENAAGMFQAIDTDGSGDLSLDEVFRASFQQASPRTLRVRVCACAPRRGGIGDGV